MTNAELKEADEEFYEDFSGWEITDDELEDTLARARPTGDVRLRRIVKQNQYFRWLLRTIIEQSDESNDIATILDMSRRALKISKQQP